jgi:S-adenosylmethionine-diacylglycerol 3-amino-3-carboxypropyl transferase
VIFRTAGPDSILEGRVPASILGAWRYDRDRSAQLFARDRSAIYGGFHLYRRQAES